MLQIVGGSLADAVDPPPNTIGRSRHPLEVADTSQPLDPHYMTDQPAVHIQSAFGRARFGVKFDHGFA